ncbi:DUF2865 domain-containing protein [Methyloligella sp. 2.7D]|uniref:DUF2865 domain-containing protein n=1 Tax=unclassified Methyloligella TaxID=2625955 RepID=UPI00157BDCB7|nr:DUF2865 domain-containing protein [Methyloligella sp. GL2]QKP77197.1 DUF2865 domain-containing protein [Methyloligella sp. GL2]
MIRSLGGKRKLAFASLAVLGLAGAGVAIAQPMNDQQLRCMQLEQELASLQGGGGREQLPMLDQEIASLRRAYRGTESAMERADCFESFFIFGRGVVRTPRCQRMNAQLEDSRRQLKQLQDRRDAIASGRGARREIADLQDALARNGCRGGQSARRGGLFDWFGGGGRDDYGAPVSRQILSGVPYRTVCVRLCDGFFYPINYSVYSNRFSRDANQCQASCAAPAELYVYRNPGQEIESAISLNGMPYVDLPVAFKYRKEYVKGCSCKQVEYNPTEIEAHNTEKAQAEAAKSGATAAAQPNQPPASQAMPFDPDSGNASDLQLDFDTNVNDADTYGMTPDTGPGAGNQAGVPSGEVPLSPGAEEAGQILNGGDDGWAPLEENSMDPSAMQQQAPQQEVPMQQEIPMQQELPPQQSTIQKSQGF